MHALAMIEERSIYNSSSWLSQLTAVLNWKFLAQNSAIQVSIFKKVTVQKLVFSQILLNELRSGMEGKITLFYSFLFISIALINILEQLKPFLLVFKKCQVSSKLWLLGASTVLAIVYSYIVKS